jgi:hypothetical protein
MKKNQEVAVVNKQELEILKDLYPVEASNFNRILLPRIGFASQDQTEGKGKAMKVVTEAGTFSIERQSEELDENGKKIWTKEEIGTEMDGIILYHRYQLSFYDEETEEYTSSPVYDSQDEVLPLWCNKKEVAKGTPAELKKLYEFVGQDGKKKSKLKDNRIVYVLHKDELFQLNLHGSSMYSFLKYVRSVNPPSVITHFSSESQEKGTIAWNMMTFKVFSPITSELYPAVVEKVKEIKMAIQLEKGASNETPAKYAKVDDEMDEELKKF